MVEATVERSGLSGDNQPAAKLDVMDQLMKPEAQEALVQLVQQLPKLAELTGVLAKTYDLASRVAGDRVLVEDMVQGVVGMVKPIEEKIKGISTAVMEANERAEQSQQEYGMFDVLRMLKEPEVQHMLRFAQAYLEISRERKY